MNEKEETKSTYKMNGEEVLSKLMEWGAWITFNFTLKFKMKEDYKIRFDEIRFIKPLAR